MRTILANEIAAVLCLGWDDQRQRFTRPVWLLTFTDGSRLVFKREGRGNNADIARSINLGSAVMGSISQGVDAAVLTPAEVLALKSLGPAVFGPKDDAARRKANIDFWDLYKGADNQGVYIKMAFVENLKAADSMAAKGKSIKLLEKLKARGAMHAFGGVLAVDLFLGNTDRISGSGKLRGSVQNFGNLVFQKMADGSYRPIGLDFFDGGTGDSNLITKAPGHDFVSVVDILTKQGTTRTFADEVVDGINAAVAQHTAGVIPSDKLLDRQDARELAIGIRDGADKIRAKVWAMWTSTGIPPGLQLRMEKLGWANSPPPFVVPSRPRAAANPMVPPGGMPALPAPPRPTSSPNPFVPPQGMPALPAPPRPTSSPNPYVPPQGMPALPPTPQQWVGGRVPGRWVPGRKPGQ